MTRTYRAERISKKKEYAKRVRFLQEKRTQRGQDINLLVKKRSPNSRKGRVAIKFL